MASSNTKVVLSVVSGALCIGSLILNLFFIIILLCKVKQWKKTSSANYLLINITFADLLMTVFWGIPTIVTAASWDWLLGDSYCKFHDVIATWCYVVVMNTLCVISIEKVILFWWPSKHKEVFYHTVVLILVSGLWAFSLVIALFPVMGWGEVWYSPYQIQCAEDYKVSDTLLNFKFVITFMIPFIVMIILYSLGIHKVFKARNKGHDNNGKVVLQEDNNVPPLSYGEKYAQEQLKLKRKRKIKGKAKANEKKVTFRDKNTSNQSEQSEDNMATDENHDTSNERYLEYEERDDGYDTVSIGSESDETEDYITLAQRKKALNRKRTYFFKEQEFKLAVTMFIASITYSLCWFPLIVVSYYWAYNFNDPPSTDVIAVVTCLTLFGLLVKPLIYLTNGWIRSWIAEACKRKQKDNVHTNAKKKKVPTATLR